MMRILRAVALGVLIAPIGCVEKSPTSEGDAATPPALASVATSPTDRVRIEMHDAQWSAGGGNRQVALEFLLEHLADGVALTHIVGPSATFASRLREPDGLEGRKEPFRTSVTLSRGLRFYDAAGHSIPLAFAPERRTAAGLSAAPSRPLTVPRDPRTVIQNDRTRFTRLVTSELAQRRLADLRLHSDQEERVGPTRLRFVRMRPALTETWVYDEEVGAVVETIVVREAASQIKIQDEYHSTPAGYVLSRRTTEWLDDSGSLLRRSSIRFD